MSNNNNQEYPLDQGSYKILAEIGSGAHAVVYKAVCLPMGPAAVVAIKSVDLDGRPSDETCRESKTMSLLSHPNILTAHCSFAVGRRLWVVMPFMSAGSLASILASSFPSGLPEPAIAPLLRYTLSALSYLHDQGHLHRDVKAGNILVDSAGTVKLADFGVSASIYDSPSPVTDVAGTPYWMAPEVILHSVNGYGTKADIWSFGITALELAHGRPPLSHLPLSESLLVKVTRQFRFSDYSGGDSANNTKKKFSRAFKEMVGLCLSQDPGKRPTAEKLLKHSFFRSFKQGTASEFLAKNVLHGLPSVEERFRVSKNVVSMVENDDLNEEELKDKRRRISGWNFNEEGFELDPVFPSVRFGGETVIEPSSQPGLDREKVLRDLLSLRTNLESERKTLAEIMRVLGAEEETREAYLERTAAVLRSELEAERRRNSELQMEVEFLRMEIQRYDDEKKKINKKKTSTSSI